MTTTATPVSASGAIAPECDHCESPTYHVSLIRYSDQTSAYLCNDCAPTIQEKQMNATTAQIAKAAGIAPRTKRFVLRDEYGIAYDGSRTEHVLSAVARHDLTPNLDQATHIAARAAVKAITTGRMNPTLANRMQQFTPYQVCKVVAYIVGTYGAQKLITDSVGPVADYWLNEHSDEITAIVEFATYA